MWTGIVRLHRRRSICQTAASVTASRSPTTRLHRQLQPRTHVLPTTIAGVTSRRGSQIIVAPVDEDAAASFNELLVFFYAKVVLGESVS
ncbi:Os10g0317300 [Oryza sativa Japonica Group]|uniref:Os10g0317300 protein n=1 Tax=Oryza sativa subsp. japonica TaxID=39947 RepID=Q0IYG9_ORYSJ|nr:Os10g0317300 [Oryza sativa Japonica Group]|eukprot:NP_001064332.1 Os10g0317300 [Oryza sativa Japonica Group]